MKFYLNLWLCPFNVTIVSLSVSFVMMLEIRVKFHHYEGVIIIRALMFLALRVRIPPWEPILRMRPYKPRDRVAAGVAGKRTHTAKSHKY
jgi:hypothetical protein